MHCSYFCNNNYPFSPCVVYLHSLNGSRLECTFMIMPATPFANKILEAGYNFCTFDFSGTGLSQGEYVSFGFHEANDIQSVIEYLHQKFGVSEVCLWGRSMGAAALIKWVSVPSLSSVKILGVVLDSPFQSLSSLAIQIIKEYVQIPEILIKAALMVIRPIIQEKAKFKMQDMELLPLLKNFTLPALFLTSKNDKLVSCSHTEQIYQAIPHLKKQIMYIRGEHNEVRQNETIDSIINFFKKVSVSTRNKAKDINQKSTQSLTVKSFEQNRQQSKTKYFFSHFKTKVTVQPRQVSIQTDSSINEHFDMPSQKIIRLGSLNSNIQEQKSQNKFGKIQNQSLKKIIQINSPKYSQIPISIKQLNRKQMTSQGKSGNHHFQFNNNNFPEPPSLKKFQTEGKNANYNKSPLEYTPITPFNHNSNHQFSGHMQSSSIFSPFCCGSEIKRQCKQNEIQELRNAFNSQHFNVASDKIKKRKKRDTTIDNRLIQKYDPKIKNRTETTISVDRKYQLEIKMPPEMAKNKKNQ